MAEDSAQLLGGAAEGEMDDQQQQQQLWDAAELAVDQPDTPQALAADSEAKVTEVSEELLARIREEAAASAREELVRVMGPAVKYFTDPTARDEFVSRIYFAASVETTLSSFVRHVFSTAVAEIVLMIIALLFYFGDSSSTTAHYIFMFVLHILRAPAVLWLLNRVPPVEGVVVAVADVSSGSERERKRHLSQMRSLKTPLIGITILTMACGFMDVLTVFIRLFSFHDVDSAGVVVLLLALAFCTIDLSAVMWFFSLRYNLPPAAFNTLSQHATRISSELTGTVANYARALSRRGPRGHDGRIPLAGGPEDAV